MNRMVLVACGVLVVACVGACVGVWSSPATAAGDPPCLPTESTCSPQISPNAAQVPGGSTYTVTKSASPSGHVQPGQTVTYTVTVTAGAAVDAGGASFTDDLHQNVLDDATWHGFAGDSHGADYDSDVVTWANSSPLTADQTVSVSYSVIVDDPDTGDGVLRNSVEAGANGACGSCAVTNAVEGTFTVRETASPAPGSPVHPGEEIKYTVEVTGGDAPAYASFTDALSANAGYAGDARATDGTVSVQGGTVSWNGSLAARATATVTFAATVRAGGTGRVTSTVRPVSNDPSHGSCAADGACRISYRVLAPVQAGGPTAVTTAATTGPSSSGSAAAAAAPTTSLPHIADTGARTAGMSELAALLLLGGLGLLLLGLRPSRARRQRERHRG